MKELDHRIKFNRDYDFDTPQAQVSIMKLETATPTAELAFAFIGRWGMIAGMDGGEDSAGRHKVRLATAQEVVDRAFEIAKMAAQRARDEGLLVQLPDWTALDEAEKKRAEEKAAKKAAKATA